MFLTFLISQWSVLLTLLGIWISFMPNELSTQQHQISVTYHGTAPKIVCTSLWCGYKFSNSYPTDMASGEFMWNQVSTCNLTNWKHILILHSAPLASMTSLTWGELIASLNICFPCSDLGKLYPHPSSSFIAKEAFTLVAFPSHNFITWPLQKENSFV